MIVKWFLDLVAALWEALCAALPSFDPPSWVTDSGSLFSTIFGYASGMGAWVPVSLGLSVATAVLTCVLIGFGIKAVRIAASFLTAGGGSAG